LLRNSNKKETHSHFSRFHKFTSKPKTILHFMKKTIKWGILSTAKIAKDHMINAIRESSMGEVYAVASRDAGKAAAFASETGIPHVHASYEALLADPAVDAIYLPLPVSLHRKWSLRCLEAGKPVLCEKPLCANASEAREVLEAFEHAGVLISEGYMYRHNPLNHKVRELINSGSIGELRMILSTFNISLPPEDIRFKPEMGGGALLDLGCYCVGISRFLTGEEPVEIQGCFAIGKTSGVDESAIGNLRFPGGALASFVCSLKSAFEISYQIFGSEGRILVERGAMVAWPGEAFTIKVWKGEQYEEIVMPPFNHYTAQIEAFQQALLEGKTEATPHAESGIVSESEGDGCFEGGGRRIS